MVEHFRHSNAISSYKTRITNSDFYLNSCADETYTKDILDEPCIYFLNLVKATKYECVGRGAHSTSDLPCWEIKSQPNQSSAHVMNFRSKQLDSVFTPKAEITGPVYHSIIKNKLN